MRKLPVYLIVDTSTSMRGEPIAAVEEGIRVLHNSLRRNPYALEVAYLSVITFATEVVQLVPLTEVALFTPPKLVAKGRTNLGAALAGMGASVVIIDVPSPASKATGSRSSSSCPTVVQATAFLRR